MENKSLAAAVPLHLALRCTYEDVICRIWRCICGDILRHRSKRVCVQISLHLFVHLSCAWNKSRVCSSESFTCSSFAKKQVWDLVRIYRSVRLVPAWAEAQLPPNVWSVGPSWASHSGFSWRPFHTESSPRHCVLHFAGCVARIAFGQWWICPTQEKIAPWSSGWFEAFRRCVFWSPCMCFGRHVFWSPCVLVAMCFGHCVFLSLCVPVTLCSHFWVFFQLWVHPNVPFLQVPFLSPMNVHFEYFPKIPNLYLNFDPTQKPNKFFEIKTRKMSPNERIVSGTSSSQKM